MPSALENAPTTKPHFEPFRNWRLWAMTTDQHAVSLGRVHLARSDFVNDIAWQRRLAYQQKYKTDLISHFMEMVP